MSNCVQSSECPQWLNDRASGLLLHPSSLPSNHGIGSIGSNAYKFIDFLEKSGFTFWQTCPIGPTGFGDSPYQVFCSSAGNPYFIDWNELVEFGLIECWQLSKLENLSSNQVDYGSLYSEFYPVARLAYTNFSKQKGMLESHYGDYHEFKSDHSWLGPYSAYQALKLQHNNQPWWLWADEYKDYSSIDVISDQILQEADFHTFLQYIFFGQWRKLKAYANGKNISLLGDLPIYAAPDSSDVWANQNLFQLNKTETCFKNVAGVPPDYFNENGQLWGNPLYKWEAHKNEDFAWWIDRLHSQLEFFDVVRIDHFRGFHDYWSIPASSGDAKAGEWVDGPGMMFWNKINKEFPNRPFLAEDLGLITDGVRSLRDQAGLPGMAVLQFAFDGEVKNLYLPHNLKHNLVLYLGTHDNDTTCGWYQSSNEEVCGNFRSYLNVPGNNPSWDLIRFAYRTIAPLVVVPIQDLLGLGSEARFNSPGEPEGNWRWRLSEDQLIALFKSSDYLRSQAKITGRLRSND
jgi:4-alpha-glucanotransferase